MNTPQLIRDCQQQGIRLFPNGDKLRVVPPPGKPLTPELLTTLKAHKPDILAALAHEDAAEYVSERSAICEANGLRPCSLRPVFEYRLNDDPHARLIMLGIIGQTLEQATESLRDRLGAFRVLSVELYQWPQRPDTYQG